MEATHRNNMTGVIAGWKLSTALQVFDPHDDDTDESEAKALSPVVRAVHLTIMTHRQMGVVQSIAAHPELPHLFLVVYRNGFTYWLSATNPGRVLKETHQKAHSTCCIWVPANTWSAVVQHWFRGALASVAHCYPLRHVDLQAGVLKASWMRDGRGNVRTCMLYSDGSLGFVGPSDAKGMKPHVFSASVCCIFVALSLCCA